MSHSKRNYRSPYTDSLVGKCPRTSAFTPCHRMFRSFRGTGKTYLSLISGQTCILCLRGGETEEHKKTNWTNKTPRPDCPVERVFQMRLMICDWVSGFLEIPASFQLPSSIRRCILGRERDRPPWLCQWKKKGGGKLSLREIKRYSKCFDDPHSHSTKSFESR